MPSSYDRRRPAVIERALVAEDFVVAMVVDELAGIAGLKTRGGRYGKGSLSDEALLLLSFRLDRRIALAAVIGLALAGGPMAASWMPRGPPTTAEALGSMLLTLVAFAVASELGRLDLSGPTVDGFEASFYGLLAFIVGRGFHGVLSLLWMALGAFIGYAIALVFVAAFAVVLSRRAPTLPSTRTVARSRAAWPSWPGSRRMATTSR